LFVKYDIGVLEETNLLNLYLNEILKRLELENPVRTSTFVIDQMGIFQILNYLIYGDFVTVDDSLPSVYNKDILSEDYTKDNLYAIKIIGQRKDLRQIVVEDIKRDLISLDVKSLKHPVFTKSKEDLKKLLNTYNDNFLIYDIFQFMINPIIIHHKFKQKINAMFASTTYKYRNLHSAKRWSKMLSKSSPPTYGHTGKEIARNIILGLNSNA
jgi:ribosomal protein L31